MATLWELFNQDVLNLVNNVISTLTNWYNALGGGYIDGLVDSMVGILSALLVLYNELIGGTTSFFKFTIDFLTNYLPAFLIQLFSFLIFIIPMLISMTFFVLTHWYLILIMFECIILVKVIITRGFMQKLNMWFYLHVNLIRTMIALPVTFANVFGEFAVYLKLSFYSIKIVLDVTSIAWERIFHYIADIKIATIPVGRIIIYMTVFISLSIFSTSLLLVLAGVN